GKSADARDIIERFALRAFRDNPPQPGYIDKLVNLFEARLKAGFRTRHESIPAPAS
ncbi:MAG: DUF1595 domain-containing protein, partial [Planctomycetes bacterium]|nr:DUF1595 domain-containing protein [Planctomycetota bacterium]